MSVLPKKRVAVLISGRGSNMEALIGACAQDTFPAHIVSVVSNRPDAAGLTKAASAGLSTKLIDHKAYDSRESFEDALHQHLVDVGAEIVCLAGFMRLLSASFVERWDGRMLNIHPSLLPAFKGLDTHERALETGVRFHGCTVHFVSADMDAGPIITQAVTPVRSDDTPETLGARVLTMEHAIYPHALRLVAEDRTRIHAGCVMIKDAVVPDGSLMNPAAES